MICPYNRPLSYTPSHRGGPEAQRLSTFLRVTQQWALELGFNLRRDLPPYMGSCTRHVSKADTFREMPHQWSQEQGRMMALGIACRKGCWEQVSKVE